MKIISQLEQQEKYSVLKFRNILRLFIRDVYNLSTKEVDQIIQEIHAFCDKKPHHIMLVTDPGQQLKKFPRIQMEQLFSNSTINNRLSLSIVLSKHIQKLTSSIIKMMQYENIPLKIVTSEEEAIAWITTLYSNKKVG